MGNDPRLPSPSASLARADFWARDRAAPGVPTPIFRGRPVVYVAPGELMATTLARAARTLLGSCVAVCLWDGNLRIGGMTHYLLPDSNGHPDVTPRYGDVAVAVLLERLHRLGARVERLEAKIFGGARVLPVFPGDGARVGDKNIALARDIVGRARIPIRGEDVGGDRGRKLIFCTDDGSAWVRRL